jgi:hypothetical protein
MNCAALEILLVNRKIKKGPSPQSKTACKIGGLMIHFFLVQFFDRFFQLLSDRYILKHNAGTIVGHGKSFDRIITFPHIFIPTILEGADISRLLLVDHFRIQFRQVGLRQCRKGGGEVFSTN